MTIYRELDSCGDNAGPLRADGEVPADSTHLINGGCVKQAGKTARAGAPTFLNSNTFVSSDFRKLGDMFFAPIF